MGLSQSIFSTPICNCKTVQVSHSQLNTVNYKAILDQPSSRVFVLHVTHQTRLSASTISNNDLWEKRGQIPYLEHPDDRDLPVSCGSEDRSVKGFESA